ncbi:hypothetical protein NOC27_2514 [Nitrosococcus oceani AFC27]|uniref:hypothetical protein n=1 Tax=Nitrosococcus oceani TaxID=1229 RepID=UPI000183C644|nr:hypothetical protein [Nitrosococcus oceani]EDZ65834.1 hypothetical protein NOC27_2514 [Nitrosococcus oceani AFC27]GEM20311.1 hypothetical protein NONS58_17240 [Nitrosococcus oceani]
MTKPKEENRKQKKSLLDRLLETMSRFIVSLTWGILLAVVVFVVYLVTQASQL